MGIIKSILETDAYKISMQNFILELYPDAIAHYKFINRRLSNKFNSEFVWRLAREVYLMSKLQLTSDELDFIKRACPFLTPLYLEYLKNYRFDPTEVDIRLNDGDLSIDIRGPWHKTVLWEVPLMALISELYFEIMDKDWEFDKDAIKYKAYQKITKLYDAECYFADFGTRRRRSYETQEIFVKSAVNFDRAIFGRKGFFVGTSNVYLAFLNNIKPIGTYAHEIPMAMQALEGIRNSNYYAMDNWSRVFKASLGIALTDTITTDQFLKNFNLRFAKLYDGVRQDSGSPFEFADKVIAHYEMMKIDPLSKTIVFSDGLDVDKAIEINNYCKGKIKCSFGIGTSFTNDIKNSPALNMVIKLHSINNIPVVKLSDSEGKECGDSDAVRVTKWIVNNTPLNAI